MAAVLHSSNLHKFTLSLSQTLCVSHSVVSDSLQSMDRGPSGSSDNGIIQAIILEWWPCPPPRDLPDPGIEPASLWQAVSLPLAPPEQPLGTITRHQISTPCFMAHTADEKVKDFPSIDISPNKTYKSPTDT